MENWRVPPPPPPRGVGVGRSRISQQAAEVKKNEENGKMGGNGGKWGKRQETCQKYRVGNVEKMCEIRRKGWRKKGLRGGGGGGLRAPFLDPPFRARRSGSQKSGLHNPKKDRPMMNTDFQHFPAPHQQWWYLCPVNFGYIH